MFMMVTWNRGNTFNYILIKLKLFRKKIIVIVICLPGTVKSNLGISISQSFANAMHKPPKQQSTCNEILCFNANFPRSSIGSIIPWG